MDWRSFAADGGIGTAALDVTGDSSSMDVILDGVEFAWRGLTISKEIGNVVKVGRPQRLFHIPRPTRRRDDWVRRVGGPEGPCQVLRRQHLKMVSHWELTRLRVQVLDAGDPVTAGDNAETCILDSLQTLNGRLFGVGGPNGCTIVELRADERFVSD